MSRNTRVLSQLHRLDDRDDVLHRLDEAGLTDGGLLGDLLNVQCRAIRARDNRDGNHMRMLTTEVRHISSHVK